MNLKAFSLLGLMVVAGIGCNRDPEVAKRKYLENGNRYYEAGKIKEASIMYRNALKKDQKFAEAYYRLGLTELQQENLAGAFQAFIRTKELDPSNVDARVKLGDLIIGANSYESSQTGSRPAILESYAEELGSICNDLEKEIPGQYDALRLRGAHRLMEAQGAARRGVAAESQKLTKEAFDLFERANQAKPNQPAMVMTLAGYLASQTRFNEAEKMVLELLNHVKDDPKNYRTAINFLYMQYAGRNRVEDAENILKRAIADQPDQLSHRAQLVGHYVVLRRGDDAARAEQEMLGSGDRAKAEEMLGDVYLRLRGWEKAQKHYEEAIRQNPAGKGEYQKKIADLLVFQDKKAEATAVLEEVLRDKKDDNGAASRHAALLLESTNPEQVTMAVTELEAAVARDQQNPRPNPVLRLNLGRAYAKRGEFAKARLQFEEAVKIRPDFRSARLALAEMHLQSRQFGEAEAEAKRVLASYPNDAEARTVLGTAQMAGRSFDNARVSLNEALRLNPSSLHAQLRLGSLNLLQQRYREAEDIFRKIYEQRQDLAGLQGLMQVNAAQGQDAKSLQLLRAEVAKHPDQMMLRELLANAAARSGEYETAQAEFQRLIDSTPNTAGPELSKLTQNLAEVHRLRYVRERSRGNEAAEQDLEKAVDLFQRARDLNPQDPRPTYHLALIFDGQGDRKKAEQLYQEVLRLRPEDAVALNNLAYLWAEHGGDLDQALSYVSRAKQAHPENPEIADTLGYIYIKKQLADNAISVYRDLIRKQPEKALFHYRMALALDQKGDRLAARQSLQTALQKRPNKDEETKIRDLMARLG